MIHLGEQYFPCCCFLPVTLKIFQWILSTKCLQSRYQIWDCVAWKKILAPEGNQNFVIRPTSSHTTDRHFGWYTCLTILKVVVFTAYGNIKLLCIVPHSRFIINLLSVKTLGSTVLYRAHQTLILISYQTSTSYKMWGIHAVGVHSFQRDEIVLSGKCLSAFWRNTLPPNTYLKQRLRFETPAITSLKNRYRQYVPSKHW